MMTGAVLGLDPHLRLNQSIILVTRAILLPDKFTKFTAAYAGTSNIAASADGSVRGTSGLPLRREATARLKVYG
jgi:hypothetical protein